MAKVLFMDDDEEVAFVVAEALASDQHDVVVAKDGTSALRALSEIEFDLLILDRILPDISGDEVLRRYRAAGGIAPAVFLSGKTAIDDRVAGFSLGADDYITKPFHCKELCARVRALLRRSAGQATSVLKVGPLDLDPVCYRVCVNGMDVHLAPKEFALLEFFMRHPDHVFGQQELLARVWYSDSEAGLETLRTCIKRLRQKLGMGCKNSMLRTVSHVGYMLASSVQH